MAELRSTVMRAHDKWTDTRDATSIAYTVGYESASQFSREYARLFGLPPARDAARFKLPPAAKAEPVS